MRFTLGCLALASILSGCADTRSVAPSGGFNEAPLQDVSIRNGAHDIALVNRCGAMGPESHKLSATRSALKDMATGPLSNSAASFEAAYREEFAKVEAEPMPSMEECQAAASRVASLTGAPVVTVTGHASRPKPAAQSTGAPGNVLDAYYQNSMTLAQELGGIAGAASMCGASTYRLDRFRENTTVSLTKHLRHDRAGTVGIAYGRAFAEARLKPQKERLSCSEALELFHYVEASGRVI